MHEAGINLFKYVGISWISLCVMFHAGLILTSPYTSLKDNNFTKIFIALVIPLVLSVIGFSIYTTKGITSFLGLFILLFAVLIVISGKDVKWAFNLRVQRDVVFKFYLFSSIFCIIHGAILFVKYYFQNEGILFISNADFALYAERADFLYITGQENKSGGANLISDVYHGVSPYHYFDLYLSKLLGTLFNLKTLFCYAISSTILLSFILYIGSVAMCQTVSGKKNILIFILALIPLIAVGYTLPIYYEHEFLRNLLIGSFDNPVLSSIHFPRSSISLICFAGATLAWMSRRMTIAYVMFLILPFMNIGYAPSVLPAFVLYGVWQLAIKKTKRYRLYLTYAILVIAFLCIFYAMFSADVVEGGKLILPLSNWTQVLGWALYAVKYAVRYLVLYAPLIVVLLYSSYKGMIAEEYKELLIFYSLILLCGLISGSFLYQNFDGIQLFTNVGRDIALILVTVTCVRNIKHIRLKYLARFLGSSLVVIAVFSQIFYLANNKFDNKSNAVTLGHKNLNMLNETINRTQSSDVRTYLILRERFNRYPAAINTLYNLHNNVLMLDAPVLMTDVTNYSAHKFDSKSLIENNRLRRYARETIKSQATSIDLDELINDLDVDALIVSERYDKELLGKFINESNIIPLNESFVLLTLK